MTTVARSGDETGTDIPGTTPDRQTTVVFADVEPWEGFLQFAAALRRRGVRVTRLTSQRRGAARRTNDVLQGLVFHETHATVVDGGQVTGGLPTGRDHLVEAVDQIATTLLDSGRAQLRTENEGTEVTLYDKLAMSDYAAALGIAIPRSWAAEDGPNHPAVLKPRLGAGGAGIEFVHTAAHAARAWHRGAAEPGRWMMQDRAPGATLHVGGVASAGTLVAVAAYEAAPAPEGHFGPSAEIHVLEDPAALAATATLVAGLRYTGAFCLDFVRAADGTPLLVDVNARIFGSWLALQIAGLDIVGAYLRVHGLGGPAEPSRLRLGDVVRVLPPGPVLPDRGSLVAPVRAQLDGLSRAAGVLGLRWVAVTVVRLSIEVVRQLCRRGVGRFLPGRTPTVGAPC